MTSTDQSQFLCEEVLNQASVECDQILSHAREEANSLVHQANLGATRLKAERLAIAKADAERRRRFILDTAPVEIARRRLTFLEASLERIRGAARDELIAHQSFAYCDTVATLVSAAMAKMAGSDFVVKLSVSDRSNLTEALMTRTAVDLNRPDLRIEVIGDASIRDGAVVESADGHQTWDCRLPSRLKRVWPAIREQLAAQLTRQQSANQRGEKQ